MAQEKIMTQEELEAKTLELDEKEKGLLKKEEDLNVKEIKLAEQEDDLIKAAELVKKKSVVPEGVPKETPNVTTALAHTSKVKEAEEKARQEKLKEADKKKKK